MLRLLLCLICGLATAGALLLMRQQRLELQHECNAVHDQMLGVQRQLWSQQVQIASAVAPGSLKEVLAQHAQRAARERPAAGAWDANPSRHAAADEWSLLE